MLRKKNVPLPARPPRFDRFQTAVAGLGFVPSAIGARFDPYSEPALSPRRSLGEMERVERVPVGPA